MRHQLLRDRVELVHAETPFIDRRILNLSFGAGRGSRLITADKVVIA